MSGTFVVWKFALALFVAGVVNAEVRSVCLEDRVGVNGFVRKAFDAELLKLGGLRQLSFASNLCQASAVSLVISAHPPTGYATALGLARNSGQRVLPELHIYLQPVRRIIGERASAAQLGRALARVAAHELEHYLDQRTHHDHEGLMRSGFQPDQLAAEDSTAFRLTAKR